MDQGWQLQRGQGASYEQRGAEDATPTKTCLLDNNDERGGSAALLLLLTVSSLRSRAVTTPNCHAKVLGREKYIVNKLVYFYGKIFII